MSRARGMWLVALLMAMGCEPKAPPLAAEQIPGFVFMDPPKTDIRVTMDAMLSTINAAEAERARQRGSDTSTAFVGVDSTGAVIAGTGSSLREPQLLLVYGDSAWAQLKARNAPGLDSITAAPDFHREVVLVSWYPPMNLTNTVVYQTIGVPTQRDSIVTVELGAAFMPAAGTIGATTAWQGAVWRVQRGTARAMRVTFEDGRTLASFALPQTSSR